MKAGIKKTACAVIFRFFRFFDFFAFSVFCSALRGETLVSPAVRDGVHEAFLVAGAAATLLNVVDAAKKRAVVKMIIQSVPAVKVLAEPVNGRGVQLGRPRLGFGSSERAAGVWALRLAQTSLKLEALSTDLGDLSIGECSHGSYEWLVRVTVLCVCLCASTKKTEMNFNFFSYVY